MRWIRGMWVGRVSEVGGGGVPAGGVPSVRTLSVGAASAGATSAGALSAGVASDATAPAGVGPARGGPHVSAEVSGALLSLERLNVTFLSPHGDVHAVRDLSLAVAPGECLGVVGESGAGKSQAFLAALGLLPTNGRATGRALFGSVDLLTLRQPELDRIRGARIGMVFQDPMTSLTPHIRIGDQIAEPIIRHIGASPKEAKARALALLNQVHVNDAERRMRQYPHELSGGMRQRVMIAIALSCDPVLLIADEPTTALDVTIQAQILDLLQRLQERTKMAIVFITHNLGVVAEIAHKVMVMYCGRIVERGDVVAMFKAPLMPYTRGLLHSVPRLDLAGRHTAPLSAIPGN